MMDNKMSKKLITIVAASVSVVCLVLIGWILVFPSIQYNDAMDLYENEEYLQAAEIFEKLRNFKDSEEQFLECNYLYAKDIYKSGNYPDAADMFADLEDYKDSAEYLLQSENHIKYIEAKELLSKEDYEQAEKLFLELGDFKDSAKLAGECTTELNYINANLLMESGNYEEAKLLFESTVDYKDSYTLALICSYKIMYLQAQEKADAEEFSEAYKLLDEIENNTEANEIELSLVADTVQFTALMDECYKYYCYDTGNKYFEEGEYYVAYTWFNATDVYDSAEKAQDCIQPFVSGEIYSNPDYSANEVTIIFRPQSGYTKCECIKIVTTKDVVSIVAIAPGQSVRISIPEGVYSIVGAAGTTWFGEDAYFGNEGHYYKVKYSEDVCFAGDTSRKLYISLFTTTIEIGESGGDGNLTSNEISYYSFLSYK